MGEGLTVLLIVVVAVYVATWVYWYRPWRSLELHEELRVLVHSQFILGRPASETLDLVVQYAALATNSAEDATGQIYKAFWTKEGAFAW